jgi:hypothetical protein
VANWRCLPAGDGWLIGPAWSAVRAIFFGLTMTANDII